MIWSSEEQRSMYLFRSDGASQGCYIHPCVLYSGPSVLRTVIVNLSISSGCYFRYQFSFDVFLSNILNA